MSEDINRILKTAEPISFELYNLRDDVGETTDLAGSQSAKLAELKALLLDYFHDVQRETPTWPAFADPGYERDRIEWPDYVAKPLPAAPPEKPR